MGYNDYYNVGLGMDSLMNDTCWQRVAQMPNANNPAFRGGSATSSATDTTATTTKSGSDPYLNGVNTSDVQTIPTSSSAGMSSGGAAALAIGGLTIAGGAAACIVAAKKGNGKGIIEGFKIMLGKAKPTKAMKEFTLIAKDGSKVFVKDGKIVKVHSMGEAKVLTTPGEIDWYKHNENLDSFKWYDEAAKKLTKGVTLTGYSFDQQVGKDTYKFVVRDGEIKKIYSVNNGTVGNEVDKKVFEELVQKREVLDRIASLQRGGNAKNLTAINNYSEEVSYNLIRENDNIYSYVTMGAKGEKLKSPKEIVTIKGTLNEELTETQRKAWLQNHQEVDALVKEVIANGRAENVVRKSFTYKATNGDKVFVNEEGEITQIEIYKGVFRGKKTIKKGTDDFDAYLYDHGDIKTEVKEFFDSGLATDGAVFRIPPDFN